MATIVLSVTFILGIIIGLPLPFTMGTSAMAALLVMDKIPLVIIPQRLVSGVNSFSLLAIPLFVLIGNLMSSTGITKRLVRFSNSLVGHITGGLALVNVLASMFFAGVSGSATADTASIGSVLIPSMVENGYDADYSVAVTASSSCCGPIIPPSITMVIYGVLTGVSITDLFLGGYVPGIAMGLGLMIPTYIIAKKRHYPKNEGFRMLELWLSFKSAFWALILPLIIIGGILTGVFTVTESAAIAAVYTIFISMFIHRDLTFKNLLQIMCKTAIQISALMTVAASALIFAWVITILQIPQAMTATIFKITDNPYIILLLLNVLFLVIGTFMEAKSAMFILVPMLMPMIKAVGIDPVHFGVIIVFNLMIGLVTPPVGLCLNLAAKIANISLGKSVIAILPFLAVQLIILFIITYIPATVLFIPSLF